MKPLDSVTEADPRYMDTRHGLPERHAELDAIRLHEGVPAHVRQLFETAKNLSLYSWFEYRFHPVAQLLGYAAFERALRERVAIEKQVDPDSLTDSLRSLIRTAVERKWIRSEDFENVRGIARARLKQEQAIRLIAEGKVEDRPVPLPEPSKDEVLAHAAELDFAERITESFRSLRNHLAHGGRMLGPRSAATLRVVAEAINPLFTSRPMGSGAMRTGEQGERDDS
ncbi:MAG: hypothetical protein ACREUG_04180 [Steroidobacteraceae bacterium]